MTTASATLDALDRQALSDLVHDAVAAQPVTDLHTHVYAPSFGSSGGRKVDPTGGEAISGAR